MASMKPPVDMAVVLASAVRAGWGLVLIVAPDAVIAASNGRSDRTSRTTLRVLGLRHLVQAAVVGGHPTRTFQRLGVAVDVLHASSAVALAGIDTRQRRPALTEAAIAGGWALTGWVVQTRT
jgi:hypothetical protein